MSGKSGSARRKKEMGEVSLNLNPMMDMFAVLIPALLMMSVVVEVSVINVSMPAAGGAAGGAPPKDVPLELTVTITESGYTLTAYGQVLRGSDAKDPMAPSIPIIERPTSCMRYRGTVPPPRAKNRSRSACAQDNPDAKLVFLTYDMDALAKKVIEYKDEKPDERRIIISPAPTIDFEAIADAMDATRDTVLPDGTTRILFDEVVVTPAS